MKAKALRQIGDKYRSNEERAFATFGRALLEELRSRAVVWMEYETQTFNLPGAKYTPDFAVIFDDGVIAFVEVKALIYGNERRADKNGNVTVKRVRKSAAQRGYTTTRAHLRACAELFPFFVWIEARLAVNKAGTLINDYELEVIE